jgi:hypothetical protein
LNFLPEDLPDIMDNIVGFDEFDFSTEKLVHSLERRDLFWFEAVDDETLQNRL